MEKTREGSWVLETIDKVTEWTQVVWDTTDQVSWEVLGILKKRENPNSLWVLSDEQLKEIFAHLSAKFKTTVLKHNSLWVLSDEQLKEIFAHLKSRKW